MFDFFRLQGNEYQFDTFDNPLSGELSSLMDASVEKRRFLDSDFNWQYLSICHQQKFKYRVSKTHKK